MTGHARACRGPYFNFRSAQRQSSALIRELMVMLRTNSWILILGLIAATATGARGAAQATRQIPDGNSGKVVYSVDPATLVPFALNGKAPEVADPVEFRSARAMTPEDRGVMSKAWGAMENKAAENGFDIGRKGWTYEQIVSQVFSEHVLLLFSYGSSRERSEFSAIVPRQGAEPLHVIPILRSGYSPYSAPQENPVAMAAFNRARSSEIVHEKPYWLSVSACYAALNGAHAVLPSAQTDKGGDGPADWVATPSLHAEYDGGAVAQFEVEQVRGRFAAWELTFDKNGNVIKAAPSSVKSPTLKVVKVKSPKLKVVKAAQ